MKVFAIVAQTADGFIARHSSELANWTSKEDKKLFVELTKQAGVMVMGSHTYATISQALPGRRNIVYTTHEISDAGIETTQEAPAKLVERLQAEGHEELAVIGGQAVYNMFFEAQLISEIYITIEPLMFGDGMKLLKNPADIHLKLIEYKTLNDNALMAHYKVKYGRSDK